MQMHYLDCFDWVEDFEHDYSYQDAFDSDQYSHEDEDNANK